MMEMPLDLIAAADRHADDYEGQPIPANEVRAAITNAFYAGARMAREEAAKDLQRLVKASIAVLPQLCDTSAKGMSEAEEFRDALTAAIRKG